VVLAAVGGGATLGSRKGWGVALFCAALGLSFLTVEHAGLAAWILAGAALVILARRKS